MTLTINAKTRIPSTTTASLICRTCGMKCYPDNIQCSRCGANLADVLDTDTVDYSDLTQIQINQLRAYVLIPEPNAIALIIDGKHLLLPYQDTIVIGRSSGDNNDAPEIGVDLAPFGAAQKGVSRYHLNLKRKDGIIYATDLGSRNGTWVNNARLVAYQECPLKTNDGLRVGRLVAVIRF